LLAKSYGRYSPVLQAAQIGLIVIEASQQETHIVFIYYGISFILSVLALATWTVGTLMYVPTHVGDGSGPDAFGVLLYLSLWPVGLLLAHSALLAWIVHARHPASILKGRWGLALHGVLGPGFFLYALYLFYPG
jgi:hypothetical protein